MRLERDAAIAAARRAGKTLQQIGDEQDPPISKQRVHQILHQKPQRPTGWQRVRQILSRRPASQPKPQPTGWRSRPGGKRSPAQVRPSLRPKRLTVNVREGTIEAIDAYAEAHPTTYAGTDAPRPLPRGVVVERALEALTAGAEDEVEDALAAARAAVEAWEMGLARPLGRAMAGLKVALEDLM